MCWQKNTITETQMSVVRVLKSPYDYAVDYINFFCKECEELTGKPLYNRLSDHDLTFMREYDRIK